MSFRFAHYSPPSGQQKRRSRKSGAPKRKTKTGPAKTDDSDDRDRAKQHQSGRALPNRPPHWKSDDFGAEARQKHVAGSQLADNLLLLVGGDSATPAGSRPTGDIVTLLGQGRVDPFQIYPVAKLSPFVHQIIDHAISYKWPCIVPASLSTSEALTRPQPTLEGSMLHPVKRAWLQCALEHPVAFYALAHAASQHLEWLYRGERTFPCAELLRLSYETEAIRLINEELRQLESKPVPDYVLISILSLGAHGKEMMRHPIEQQVSPDAAKSRPGPLLDKSCNPLCEAQMLNFYGSITQEAAHMSALRMLIAHNHGVSSIKLPALRGAVEIGDILNSTITQQRPCIPPPRPLPASIEAYLEPLSDLPLDPSSLPPSSKQANALRIAFGASRAVTAALSNHIASGCTTAVTLTDLVIARNHVQYSLLMLPGANGLWGPNYALYEALRMSLLIYSDFVLFPLPNQTGLKGRYAAQLREPLGCCFAQIGKGGSIGWARDAEAMLWCCFMGGLALFEAEAEDRSFREVEGQVWFAEQGWSCADVLGLDSWEEVQAVLSDWLWWREYFGEVAEAWWEKGVRSSE